ncbi:hypothetical protein PENSTE_c023G07174 [Penicillium steckii]|uniref:Uncharacterized protein n=1 Tax=Penicillium steckii TaxID=303698 RepID=A0A1V6SRJ7_9EURO|nr:hypothetical protein PENSTE_c023G07174 [Penicillium steckii]
MYALTRVLQNLLGRYLKDPPAESPYDDELQYSCILPQATLHPFEDLPSSYDPSTEWLDGQTPPYPYFDDAARIRFHVKAVKNALLKYILEGCRILLERQYDHSLLASVDRNERLWVAAISVQKYGVLYFAARWECREEFVSIMDSNLQLFNEIDSFLSRDSNSNKVINYGVHRLVNSSDIKVDYQTRLVPPTAISAIGINHIAVRAKDYDGDSIRLLGQSTAQWDLHDFAHLSAASVAPGLYGCKYFTDLIKLPSKLTALIRSPKMNTANPNPLYSDGVVFSELLTVLFTAEIEMVQNGEKKHTYESLANTLAEHVADYLLARRELQHLTTGQLLKANSPISPIELATLVQNKAYELTASEIEQRVFTRGGPVGDTRDELDSLSAVERIKFLASCRRWLYFEVRNTIKHRAHRLAYQKVAERMLHDGEMANSDRALVNSILGNIRYQGWEDDKVVNLWQEIKDSLI